MFLNLREKPYKAIKALLTRTIEFECDRIPYRFTDVPYKKILNWILVEASILIKPSRPWGRPTHLQIEPTDLCNLKCDFCHVTVGMGRPKGHMDPALFKRLIDEIGDYVFLIILWDWGEPFLNPSIYEMIAYARLKGVKVVTSTNGHLLTKPGMADKLVRSGLDTLIVALDGITQDTYELYRHGGKLETVVHGIRTVVERKRELGSATPLINLRQVVMRQNEEEIPGLKELAASLGVDALTLKTMNPYDESGALPIDRARNLEFIPKDPRYRRFEYTNPGQRRIRLSRNPCKQLWNNPAIHWNGTVCPCSFDSGENHTLGDLNNDTFENVWHGPAYRAMRRRFRKDWEKLPLCRECSYAYKGGDCTRETIAEAIFFNTGGARDTRFFKSALRDGGEKENEA
jgi:radical SAM protein with 4Fe4S-binding SPASM domain